MPAQHLPDADATPDRGEAVERGGRARRREVGEADIADRDPRRLVERLQPPDFGKRIVGAVPGGFYVHGGDDVLVCRVASVVVDEVVSSDRGEIAKRFNRAARGAKPGMPVHGEVPKMAVRVDDRSAVQSGHDGSSLVACSGAVHRPVFVYICSSQSSRCPNR